MAISRYAVCSCNAYRQMFPGDSHGPLGLGMTYKIVKSPILCHCEERSDVAISPPRHCEERKRRGNLPVLCRIKEMKYYVYILANKHCTVLYTGVTSDLLRRIYEHKNHLDKNSFTAKYNVTKLVYFEETSDVKAALEREKQIKSWKRERKTSLIMDKNPRWVDLYNEITRG